MVLLLLRGGAELQAAVIIAMLYVQSVSSTHQGWEGIVLLTDTSCTKGHVHQGEVGVSTAGLVAAGRGQSRGRHLYCYTLWYAP